MFLEVLFMRFGYFDVNIVIVISLFYVYYEVFEFLDEFLKIFVIFWLQVCILYFFFYWLDLIYIVLICGYGIEGVQDGYM